MREIKKSFIIKPPNNAEEIAEAFGIFDSYENKVIDLKLPNELPQIVYITGESGSGKSVLLKELGCDNNEIKIPIEPLFKWDKDEQKILSMLSMVGLSDATLFMQTYENLSDSQKARAIIMLKLLNDDEIIYIDEFLSTLDRLTAKSVAYCFQKCIRRLNKKAIVATAHDDLTEYLQPNLIIRGFAFPSRWEVISFKNEIINPFRNKIVIKKENKEWYRKCRLGELHYRGKYTGGVKDYLVAYYNDIVVGLLIGTYRMNDRGRRISRLVTHPSFRGIGIGVMLVKEYLKEFENADVIATMAKYNPVFSIAGMKRLDDVKVLPPTKLKKVLIDKGFLINKWYDKNYCIEFMQEQENRNILIEFANNFKYFICPAGKYLKSDELENKLAKDNINSGRALWNIRPHTLAKFIGGK